MKLRAPLGNCLSLPVRRSGADASCFRFRRERCRETSRTKSIRVVGFLEGFAKLIKRFVVKRTRFNFFTTRIDHFCFSTSSARMVRYTVLVHKTEMLYKVHTLVCCESYFRYCTKLFRKEDVNPLASSTV